MSKTNTAIKVEEIAEEKKTWDFKTQIQVGSRGEELFQEAFPTKLEVHPGHDGDFIEAETGKKVELKTDTYNMDKSPNFFIEMYSSYYEEPKKPGGPWQAQQHGCDIYCYMFVRHNTWFQFNDIPEMVNKVETLRPAGFVFIKNRAWVTAGFKIKRDYLKDIFERWEFCPGDKARLVSEDLTNNNKNKK
jgi:hypothetical protein